MQAGYATTLFQLAKNVLHRVSREWFTVNRGEYIRRTDVFSRDKFKVSAEQTRRGFANRDYALLLTFAIDDAISVFKVKQGLFKAENFEKSQTAIEHQRTHTQVADAAKITVKGQVQL